ncbi:MAG: hypothetical protein ACXAD7_08880 [Candidatus Kariarchaeaceae archaeon]|jgi:hypothetical protein
MTSHFNIFEKEFAGFPVGICPPLPDPIPKPPFPIPPGPTPWYPKPPELIPRIPPIEFPFPFCLKKLKEGCYFIRFTPKSRFPSIIFNRIHYDGTMRVQITDTDTIMSGDLYVHRGLLKLEPFLPTFQLITDVERNPGLGIPIFPIDDYRYYLRVINVSGPSLIDCNLKITFERYEFSFTTDNWTYIDTLTVDMKWTNAPSEYPSSSDYLEGDVLDSSDNIIGHLSMGWVSPYLRRAIVEIDRVADSEAPANNGIGVDWQSVYDNIGWDVDVIESDVDLQEPSGESWSDAELHDEMIDRRDGANLDAEWRYHLLCVRRLDSTSRGIMYDAYGGDSNNIPREGAAISSHWTIPNADPWGDVKGMRFGTAVGPYFRTAVHEVGHAFGLYHNTIDNGFMNTTGVIAGNAVAPVEFPDNVQWSFNSEDEKRLRHLPDIWVRPAGIPFGQSYTTTPISPNDLIQDVDELTLSLAPLMEIVPLGAPVRVNFDLSNESDNPITVPKRISMKSGTISGSVISPSGKQRPYSTIIRCIEDDDFQLLSNNEKVSGSVTLLRGREGALFPESGLHKITMQVSWEIKGIKFRKSADTNILITPAVDIDHAKIAMRLLSTPDTLLSLVISGDHLIEGNKVINAALENPILKPHFAFIEVKRIGNRFKQRKPDYTRVSELLQTKVILSSSEILKIKKLVKNASQDVINEINRFLN